jgi:hypothetical protein
VLNQRVFKDDEIIERFGFRLGPTTINIVLHGFPRSLQADSGVVNHL